MTAGTVTYAWLNLQTVNYVQQIELEAISDSRLQISLDGVNYYSSITNDMLQPIIRNLTFIDVTPASDYQTFNRVVNVGTGDDVKRIPNRDFLWLPLWFRTIDIGQDPEHGRSIYLTNNYPGSSISFLDTPQVGTYIVSKGVQFTSRYDFQYSPDYIWKRGDSGTFYGSETMRIMSKEVRNDFNPNDNRSDLEFTRFIFDPSENESRGFGKTYGAIAYYQQVNGVLLSPPQSLPTITKLSGYTQDGRTATNNVSLVTRLLKDGTYNDSLSMSPYWVGKAIIAIYCEGWDADCFDACVNDTLQIQLQFMDLIPPY